MAEELELIASTNKKERYQSLLPQIEALIGDEPDLVANLANIVSALKFGMDFFWVGFYTVKEDELVLGPFQGPIACTRIKKGKGVCGTAWEEKKTLVVDDVDQFPGHIACNSASRSEIVVPIIKDSDVVGILDVDSDKLEDFDQTDRQFLENLCQLVSNKWD